MNYIKHLTAYFEKVSTDFELNPSHVSLYMALFQLWNYNRFQSPFSISRDEVMRVSKICSKATYHKCMREIHNKGYIKYEPSYNPFRGSIVYLFDFSNDLKPVLKKERKGLKNKQADELVLNKSRTGNKIGFEQALNKFQTGSETGAEQALVSYINNTNIINSTNDLNSVNLGEQKNSDEENSKLLVGEDEKNKKLREKKDTIPPDWNDVLVFFKEKNNSEIEAEKFFNHFQSNGWLVGGKSKMKDWKAAARNWMLNATKFVSNTKPASYNQPKPAHLHTQKQKNYDEPL